MMIGTIFKNSKTFALKSTKKISFTEYIPTICQPCFCEKYSQFSQEKEGICGLYNHPMYTCYYQETTLNNKDKEFDKKNYPK